MKKHYSHLFSRKNKSLLGWRDAFLLFDSLLDSLNFVRWLDVNFNLRNKLKY